LKPPQQWLVEKEFLTDMCFALVATNIPFNKLQSTPFKNFLQKYVSQNIPDESTLRKNYLKLCFESILTKIREKLTNEFIYIMVNETTNSRGLYVCSLIILILHPEIMPTSFLISYKEFKKTNYETISRFVNDNLTEFFEDTLFQDKILFFISDAAPYMIKAGGALQIFYSNIIHIPCVAYGLNRVAEKVRDIFPGINKLVSNGKNFFLKAPHRITAYKNFMDCHFSPEPIITRWGTWLEAALFYSENNNLI
jgi:hypothetical protein